MTIRRQAFDVAVRDGGRAQRMGYVLGGWATYKQRGDYGWTFIHLQSGTSISVWPCPERQSEALAYLAHLHEHGPAEHQVRILAEHGHKWGMGL